MKTEREETWMQSEESCFGVKAWKTEAEHRAWGKLSSVREGAGFSAGLAVGAL